MSSKAEREARKQALLEKAKNPNNIPGIYNYCDRWCERCPFTSRCLNCELDESGNPEELDITNEAFWRKFRESLETAFDLLKDMAEEMGLDLNEIEPIEEEDDDGIVHMLSSLSRNYADMVSKWMKDHKDALLNKCEEQEQIPGPRLVPSKPIKEEPASLEDLLEIIRWYQHQIHVKLSGALDSKKDEEEEESDYPKDSDGSAKVALIGIDRSMGAWRMMADTFPEEKELLKIHSLLTRLRLMTEKEFPDARSFKRPGFDDENCA